MNADKNRKKILFFICAYPRKSAAKYFCFSFAPFASFAVNSLYNLPRRKSMSKSRREFLTQTTLTLLGTTVAALGQTSGQDPAQKPAEQPPGAPPAFGTAPAVGPEVSATTFAEAEKLVRVELTERDRAQAAQNWRNSMAA